MNLEIVLAISLAIWLWGALSAWVAALVADDLEFGLLGFVWPISLPLYYAQELIEKVQARR